MSEPVDRDGIHRGIAEEFEERWAAGDPWEGDGEEAAHARRKQALQLSFLGDRHDGRVATAIDTCRDLFRDAGLRTIVEEGARGRPGHGRPAGPRDPRRGFRLMTAALRREREGPCHTA